MTESMKDTLARMKPQSDEFDAAQEFARALRNLPAIVDDDYPEMRHYYERAVQHLIRAFIGNGRMTGLPPTLGATLSIEHVQATSALRAARWHPTPESQWSTLEWAGAMCGEAGEAANEAKKLKRLDVGMVGNQGHDNTDRETVRHKLGLELADNFLYTVLVAHNEGINLSDAVVEKFNLKSDEMGFPERL
jgi:NTP pyrophosphatase (non-canonical NTP hydrolase)